MKPGGGLGPDVHARCAQAVTQGAQQGRLHAERRGQQVQEAPGAGVLGRVRGFRGRGARAADPRGQPVPTVPGEGAVAAGQVLVPIARRAGQQGDRAHPGPAQLGTERAPGGPPVGVGVAAQVADDEDGVLRIPPAQVGQGTEAAGLQSFDEGARRTFGGGQDLKPEGPAQPRQWPDQGGEVGVKGLQVGREVQDHAGGGRPVLMPPARPAARHLPAGGEFDHALQIDRPVVARLTQGGTQEGPEAPPGQQGFGRGREGTHRARGPRGEAPRLMPPGRALPDRGAARDRLPDGDPIQGHAGDGARGHRGGGWPRG
ncbi:hypothetical protein [Candidatus Thiodictyon syntrophicum]|uniref:hypothetical protein n=1 Tax=Candidatus Thiodictyon syntrophicum TaxID=1166950 RepID=UPI0012FD44C8|nr:hypothetical protein [Candidatus Thiodictyon syntrophicum]